MREQVENERFIAGGLLYNSTTREVLLHLRDGHTLVEPNQWALFGGVSEDGETPRQCCVREWKEELGIEVDPTKLIPLVDYFDEGRGLYFHLFSMESDIKKSAMKLGEGMDFDWVPLENVFDLNLTKSATLGLRALIATL